MLEPTSAEWLNSVKEEIIDPERPIMQCSTGPLQGCTKSRSMQSNRSHGRGPKAVSISHLTKQN